MNEPMSHLIEAIERADVKVTFGLQPDQIERIEAELKRWEEMPPLNDGENPNPKYMKCVWDKLGKELAWCPSTLALYYFKHLDRNQNK